MIAPLRQHMYPKGSEAAAGKASGASSSNTARRFKEQGHWDFKVREWSRATGFSSKGGEQGQQYNSLPAPTLL